MKRSLLAAVALVAAVLAVYGILRLSFRDRGPGPGEETASTPPVASLPRTMEVDLFFADVAGRRLSLERREIEGENRQELMRRAVEELVRGPVGQDRMRILPEATLVRAVYAQGETVWVDLGGAVQEDHPGGAWTEVLSVYSVVNTLTENFADVSLVQILLNGRESETMAGHVDISKPLPGRIQLLAGDWE